MNARISTPTVRLTQRLSSTRRGARLARRLTAQQLHDWGIPHGGDLNDAAAHVVAELAANAVTHGHVPGRDFELHLALTCEGSLRMEVSDARGDRLPQLRTPGEDTGSSGRGLLLVAALATDWGVRDRQIGKTVWAELRLE